jgi:Flp pilus assembly protein TadB
MPAIASRPALPRPTDVGQDLAPGRPRAADDRIPAVDQDREPGDSGDSWRLMVLFLVFAITPLVVVLALWAGVDIGTWWALALVIAVHFVTTAVVFSVVGFVLSGHMPRRPGRRA